MISEVEIGVISCSCVEAPKERNRFAISEVISCPQGAKYFSGRFVQRRGPIFRQDLQTKGGVVYEIVMDRFTYKSLGMPDSKD